MISSTLPWNAARHSSFSLSYRDGNIIVGGAIPRDQLKPGVNGTSTTFSVPLASLKTKLHRAVHVCTTVISGHARTDLSGRRHHWRMRDNFTWAPTAKISYGFFLQTLHFINDIEYTWLL